MPLYRNIAPRVIGVTKGREVVLVAPRETVECTEDEAAGHLRKEALELVSSAEAEQQQPSTQGNQSELAGQTINGPTTSPTTTRTSYRARTTQQREGEESKE